MRSNVFLQLRDQRRSSTLESQARQFATQLPFPLSTTMATNELYDVIQHHLEGYRLHVFQKVSRFSVPVSTSHFRRVRRSTQFQYTLARKFTINTWSLFYCQTVPMNQRPPSTLCCNIFTASTVGSELRDCLLRLRDRYSEPQQLVPTTHARSSASAACPTRH